MPRHAPAVQSPNPVHPSKISPPPHILRGFLRAKHENHTDRWHPEPRAQEAGLKDPVYVGVRSRKGCGGVRRRYG